MTHTMVEGTSEPQDFQLLDDGAPLDGTGWTVGIEWRGDDPTGPTVDWLSQADGTVRVSGCEDMAVGIYPFRFTIANGGGALAYVPNAASADEWRVVRV